MPAVPAADPVGAVGFHSDFMGLRACRASLWIRDVGERLGLGVRWRFFSLEGVSRAGARSTPGSGTGPAGGR